MPQDVSFSPVDITFGVAHICNDINTSYTSSFRIENLCVNQFMHMFQSSWGDFADFERIFMRIKNTISGVFSSSCNFKNNE